jgi:hypothetical protein
VLRAHLTSCCQCGVAHERGSAAASQRAKGEAASGPPPGAATCIRTKRHPRHPPPIPISPPHPHPHPPHPQLLHPPTHPPWRPCSSRPSPGPGRWSAAGPGGP